MMDFLEARKEILKEGIEDIIKSDDDTEIKFILKNGKVLSLYTTEIEVPMTDLNGDECGIEFVQSEIRFMKGDLA